MVTFKGGCGKLYYIQHTLLSNVGQLPIHFFFFFEKQTHTHTHIYIYIYEKIYFIDLSLLLLCYKVIISIKKSIW